MNVHDYDVIAQALLDEARGIETAKRPAYTIGHADVLANFKRVGERTGLTAGQALAVYMLKHVDAVVTALTRPDLPQAEAVLGRFADLINYTKLGYALVAERDADVPVPAVPADPAPAVRPAATPPDRHAADRHRPAPCACPDPDCPCRRRPPD